MKIATNFRDASMAGHFFITTGQLIPIISLKLTFHGKTKMFKHSTIILQCVGSASNVLEFYSG
jgi:hypothetical protein